MNTLTSKMSEKEQLAAAELLNTMLKSGFLSKMSPAQLESMKKMMELFSNMSGADFDMFMSVMMPPVDLLSAITKGSLGQMLTTLSPSALAALFQVMDTFANTPQSKLEGLLNALLPSGGDILGTLIGLDKSQLQLFSTMSAMFAELPPGQLTTLMKALVSGDPPGSVIKSLANNPSAVHSVANQIDAGIDSGVMQNVMDIMNHADSNVMLHLVDVVKEAQASARITNRLTLNLFREKNMAAEYVENALRELENRIEAKHDRTLQLSSA